MIKLPTGQYLKSPLHQICECEGLQETIGSLKHQLSDALELRNFNPVASFSQHSTETKSLPGEHQIQSDDQIVASSDANESFLLQTQVFLASWSI